MKRGWKILLIILSLIIILFFIRLTSPKQMDDVSPEISCPEIEKYNPSVLYVIPNYDNKPISENKEWCDYILSLNKSLELHGINHQPYRKFLYQDISQGQLDFAINEFETCFNQTPEKFKPPQLKISKENKKLIKENNLNLKNWFNQLTHKVYHCDDKDKFPNKLISIF